MDKSTAKKDYRQAKKVMGVYRIRNTRTDKSYVGFSIDVPARISRHKAELNFGSHRNLGLLGEWKSSGESSFEFEILDQMDHQEESQTNPLDELQVLAEMWIRKLENAGSSVVSL